VRLGTASLAAEAGGPFIKAARLDLRKYAARPTLAAVLCDYLLYVEHDMKTAAELSALAVAHSKGGGRPGGGGGGGGGGDTDAQGGGSWWWRARLGKCYYHLGLIREAERQFQLSLEQQVRSAALVCGGEGWSSGWEQGAGGRAPSSSEQEPCAVAAMPRNAVFSIHHAQCETLGMGCKQGGVCTQGVAQAVPPHSLVCASTWRR
jgi:tetratricopeptide repeat protein 8